MRVDEARERSTAAINSVWITFRNAQPTCELEQCLNDIVTENEQRDWPEGAEIPRRVAAKAEYHGAPPAASPDPSVSTDPQEQPVSGPIGADEASSDDQKAVALSYNKQRAIPLFEFAFFLPSGVIVASFTGLMGAIGAAVYSLYAELGMLSPPAGSTAPDRTWMGFGVRPLLGALAGFTVFFVVSAGASFLIQPQAVETTQAVNQLSPPALASLGLFAGLASENALRWLIEKANSFFKSSGDGTAANA